MGIKAVLARTGGGFIGLHDLLIEMAQCNGATYQEAAAALFRLLQEANELGEKTPQWHVNNSIHGVLQVVGSRELDAASVVLQRAITGGDLKAQWEADDFPF